MPMPAKFKTAPHAREVLDLRHHHLTQNQSSSKYAGMDAISAAQSAAYRLRKRRHSFIKSRFTRETTPPPELHQQTEATLSQSSYELVAEKPARQYEEMEHYFSDICELEDGDAHTDDSNSPIYIESTEVARSESKEPEAHRKRKREASSESPAVDLSGDPRHDWKRRKLEMLEMVINRPKLPPSSLKKEWREDAEEMVRRSKSPTDSGTDVELASSDQEASKEAISNINTPQPSVKAEEKEDPFVSFERMARISERSAVNKSMMRLNCREFKKHEKPIGPSKEFQSFLATRRQRKALLLKGENMWDEEDASFMQSGKKYAEPGAGLGAEFVAKRLLNVRDAALLNIEHSTDSAGWQFEAEKAGEEVAKVQG